GLVVAEAGRGHDLDRGEAGAVADVDEAQPGLGVAPGTHPAAYRDFAAGGNFARERMFDADHRHGLNPCVVEPIWKGGSVAVARGGRRGAVPAGPLRSTPGPAARGARCL